MARLLRTRPEGRTMPASHRPASACVGVTLAAAMAFGAGCERPQAGEAATLTQAQNAVLAASNALPEGDATAMEARVQAMKAAAEPLQALVSSDNQSRKALALRLLAEVSAAEAQSLELRAREAAGSLRADLTRLATSIETLERDAARAVSQSLDPADAVRVVSAAAAEQAERLRTSQETVQKLGSDAAALETRIADAGRERNAAAGRETAQMDAAFVQGGDQKYAGLQAAGVARGEADAAASRERLAAIELESVREAEELAKRRGELAGAGLGRLVQAKDGFEAAGAEAQSAVAEAKRSANEGGSGVEARVGELARAVRERVLTPADAAVSAAGDAAERLQSAGAEAADIAAGRLRQADAGAFAAASASSFAQAFTSFAGRLDAAGVSGAAAIRSAADGLREEASTRRTSASEALAGAREAMDGVSEDDPTLTALRTSAERLAGALRTG